MSFRFSLLALCALALPLRAEEPKADLRAEARVLKLGRSLAVGDVLIFSDGQDAPVARAGLTYSIPPAPMAGGAQ